MVRLFDIPLSGGHNFYHSAGVRSRQMLKFQGKSSLDVQKLFLIFLGWENFWHLFSIQKYGKYWWTMLVFFLEVFEQIFLLPHPNWRFLCIPLNHQTQKCSYSTYTSLTLLFTHTQPLNFGHCMSAPGVAMKAAFTYQNYFEKVSPSIWWLQPNFPFSSMPVAPPGICVWLVWPSHIPKQDEFYNWSFQLLTWLT